MPGIRAKNGANVGFEATMIAEALLGEEQNAAAVDRFAGAEKPVPQRRAAFQGREPRPCRLVEAGFVERQALVVAAEPQQRHRQIEPHLRSIRHQFVRTAQMSKRCLPFAALVEDAGDERMGVGGILGCRQFDTAH
jgi:hypothetical protein